MDQRIINLYDEYIHTASISRGDFLKKLAMLTGSVAIAQTVLSQIENNYSVAVTTPDDNLFTEKVSFAGVPGNMSAYVARPKEEKNTLR